MVDLIHQLVSRQAEIRPESVAITHRGQSMSYEKLAEQVRIAAWQIQCLGLRRHDRVAVYLPKTFDAVIGFLGAAAAGAVFVPVNPLLKSSQVAHILRDCNVRLLLTSADRARLLMPELVALPDLRFLLSVDSSTSELTTSGNFEIMSWKALLAHRGQDPRACLIDTDMASILYTSGSTGKPKGVVLSHRNMVAGARSVASYLENSPDDRILAVLPFSFDYGLSQLTTAFVSGAEVALMDYLLPKDVIKAVVDQAITGLACVPPLWVELSRLEWPEKARASLRYVTNSGGRMPLATLNSLRRSLPNTKFYLMYGLTEAFRSTYLDPSEVDRRPDSMGKAIPNAEILVVREDGSVCAPGEHGELVHRGALVSLGYWNDSAKSEKRFRPAPGRPDGLVMPEFAVWSGDTVRRDEEGFLYFVGRKDEMIKTSGYRVSPTEIEEVLYASHRVSEAVALGLPHPSLGQGIAVVVKPAPDADLQGEELIGHCRQFLPNFMVPLRVFVRTTLPRNPNGKIDRKGLALELDNSFKELS